MTGISDLRKAPATVPAARRPLIARRWFRIVLKLGTLAILALAWQLASNGVSPLLLPGPHLVIDAFGSMAASGQLSTATWQSVEVFLIGYGMAVVVGVPLGVAYGRIALFRVATEHVFTAAYVTPQIALLPLFILYFGLGITAKIAIVFVVSVFPIMFNTADGMRQISRGFVEVARSYGASEVQLLREVTVPAIFPSVMTGLRLGAGRGLTGMVVAEIYTSLSGLGGIIVTSENTLHTADTFVPIIVLCMLGAIVIQGGTYLEKAMVRWKETERAY